MAEDIDFPETLHMPDYWDLVELNIPEYEAAPAAVTRTAMRVCLAHGEPVSREPQSVGLAYPNTTDSDVSVRR